MVRTSPLCLKVPSMRPKVSCCIQRCEKSAAKPNSTMSAPAPSTKYGRYSITRLTGHHHTTRWQLKASEVLYVEHLRSQPTILPDWQHCVVTFFLNSSRIRHGRSACVLPMHRNTCVSYCFFPSESGSPRLWGGLSARSLGEARAPSHTQWPQPAPLK